MNRKSALSFTLIIASVIILFSLREVPHKLGTVRKDIREVNSFSVNYKSISGLIRSPYTSICLLGDMVHVGDGAGGVSSWSYTSKKNSLNFSDNTRKISPYVTSQPIIHLEVTSRSAVALTNKGIKSYQIGVSGQFSGKSATFQLDKIFSKFILMDTGNGVTHFLSISQDHKELCLYKLAKDLNNPNPIQELKCNKTTTNLYLDVAYSPTEGLIAAGDNSDVFLFLYSNNDFGYLLDVPQPKSSDPHFAIIFPPKTQDQNKQLLTVNGNYLNMIIYDEKVPSAKILQSQKTSRLLEKGVSDEISVSPGVGDRTVLINGDKKGQAYKITKKTDKLSPINQTRVKEGFSGFSLYDTSVFFRINDLDLSVYQLKSQQGSSEDFFHQLNLYHEISTCHFGPVSALMSYNNYFVSTASTGKQNFKLWRVVNDQLTLLDQTTLSFFSVLKSGFVDPKTILMLPPLKKAQRQLSAVNDSLHILVAGSDPFNLILIPLSGIDKLQMPFKTKESHSNNVTTLLTNEKQEFVISAGLDGLIKIWTLQNNRKELNFTSTTVSKDGSIAFGIIDKTGTHVIFGHNGNDKSKLVNITIWDYDISKQKIAKKVTNVPGEAHESNLTALLLTQSQKYIISYSESGQLRLWRHEGWTMVDLLASLSLGLSNPRISLTDNDHLIVQTEQQFFQYLVDQNGFLENGSSKKLFKTIPTSNLYVNGQYLFSGDQEGCIRAYQLNH